MSTSKKVIQYREGNQRDFLKLIAHDIGKSVACHIETMYPEAVQNASSTFLLSVTNHTHNEIMALADFSGGQAEMIERLKERSAFRRKTLAFYRNLRKQRRTALPD